MRRQRRLWQYNLRTLFVLTAVAAGTTAFLGANLRDYYLEQEAVAQLKASKAPKIERFFEVR